MIDLTKYYKGSAINDDGIEVHLVDAFELPQAFQENPGQVSFGKKTKATKAYIAEPRQVIVTQHGAGEENRYTAEGGEVVFDNGGGDQFVPRDGDGKSNGAALLAEKYELVSGSLENGDAVFIPAGSPSQIIVNANQDPIRIMNPWGEGSTQDLPPGSTLKSDGDKVTGIERAAFIATWSETDKDGNPSKAGGAELGRGGKRSEPAPRTGGWSDSI